jgi:lipid-A-disaccharide synthase
MAVILPFEQELWRRHGVDAHYVGHPAMEHASRDRDSLREELGMTPYAEYVAVLPGSRPEEARRHLRPMLRAVDLLRAERGALDARVILAPSLEGSVADWMREIALRAGVSVLACSAPAVLPAFDVALAASGTVTLECTLAGVPPVVAYRTGPLSAFVAARMLRVSDVALPNLVLGRRVFPELLQDAMTPEALAEEAERLLDERASFVESCQAVHRALDTGTPASEHVARLMERWLD